MSQEQTDTMNAQMARMTAELKSYDDSIAAHAKDKDSSARVSFQDKKKMVD